MKTTISKLKSLVAKSLVAIFSLACAGSAVADAISYLAPTYVNPSDVKQGISGWTTESCPAATSVSASDTTWGDDGNDGWYVLDSDVTASAKSFTVSGDVKLILKDGFKLTVTADRSIWTTSISAIQIPSGSTLTVYAQSDVASQMGAIEANGGIFASAIGFYVANGTNSGGKLVINGGKIVARGYSRDGTSGTSDDKSGGAGLGGGRGSNFDQIVINGGVIDANGACNGAGIGTGGPSGSSTSSKGPVVVVNGGSVTAVGGSNTSSPTQYAVGGGAGIGSGGMGCNATCPGALGAIYINGGTVSATGGSGGVGNGDAIGCGYATTYVPATGTILISTAAKVYAGNVTPPVDKIANDGSTLYASLRNKQYATVKIEPPVGILAQVSTSPNMTVAVYTNGVLSSEAEAGKWYAWSNETATVVYAAKDGYAFAGNKMQVTFSLDTTKNPATAEEPTPVEAHSHDGVVFATAISNFSQLNALFSSGGSGYLTADIELSSMLDSRVQNKVVNLCLNGHVITAPSASQAINFVWGKDLFLADCQRTEHKFRVEENGRWARDEANGTETIAGGCIVGGKNAGIRVSYLTGAFRMSGINLVGCQADSGVQASGIACGSPISAVNCGFYGNLGSDGGAMYLFADANRGPFKNCIFKGNKCVNTSKYGGAVMVWTYSATSTLFEDCLFEGNSSCWHGGAIYDYNQQGNASLVLTNCIFRDNVASGKGYGGAIYAYNPLICSGCLIESNQASNVGGVYCARTLTMSDTVVQYNTSQRDAGGIYLTSWVDGSTITCTITNGAIRGNRANTESGSGGGVEVDSSRILNLYDVTVEDNVASTCGGILNSGTVNQYGGVVRRNQAGYNGGVGTPSGSGDYNLIDGKVVENCCKPKSYGDTTNGGAGVGGSVHMKVGGSAYVYGNTNTLGLADDIASDYTIGFVDGHPLTDGAKIGLAYRNVLSPGGSAIRTAANDDSVLKYFRANKSNYVVYEDATHAVGLKYPAATSIGSQAQLTAAINALTPGCTAVWNITADFAITETAAIRLNGFNLTINGNGRTLTAAQAGAELASVFNVESLGSSAAFLSVKDLNLAVGDGFRTGINVTTASGDETARTQVDCENVKISMVHTAATVGGDAVALVNANAAVAMARNSRITVNSFSRAAVDLTASAKDTVLSIESTSVGFEDMRPIAKVNTDPLIKLTDNSSGAKRVAVDGVANTSLFWVDLANGSGYNDKLYVPIAVTPVANASYKVYAGTEEVEGPDYWVVSNATDVTVVYTALSGYAFDDLSPSKTIQADTAKNPATVETPSAPLRTDFIGTEAELLAAKSRINVDDYECRWVITNDFTLAQSVVISRKGVKIDILGQGHTVTATQDGELLPYVFDAVIQRSNESYVNFSDLTLVVGDGFRNGIQAQWSTVKGGGRSMKSTLSNVTIKMARTTAPMQGGSVKYGAALVNNNSEVTLKNDVTFVLDAWCWAAIDIEANAERETTLTIDSESNLGFFDRRSDEKKAVEPLVKLTNNSPAVEPKVIGPENADLVWVELANGNGYSTHRHDGITFTKQIGTEEELRNLCAYGGAGYLTNDIVVSIGNVWVYAGEVRLCLNGHAVSRDYAVAHSTNEVFYVRQGATFAIYDCQDTPHYFTPDPTDGRWIPTSGPTDYVINGGYIYGGEGRGIYCEYVYSWSGEFGSCLSVEFHGGALVGCSGGGLEAHHATITMTGASIVGNSQRCYDDDDQRYEYDYGALYGENCCVKLTDCEFRANTGVDSVTIHTWTNSTLEVIGGVICDNVAMFACSAICVSRTDLVLGGDLLVTNNFQGGYGTVMVSDGSLVVRDQVRVVGNAKEGLGGGIIYSGEASVAISNDVQIVGNYGGDLCMVKAKSFTPRLDLNGLSPNARIGLASGARDVLSGSFGITPTSAYEPVNLAQSVSAAVRPCLSPSFVDQYLTLEDGKLDLHARIYDQPTAKNAFTYALDTYLYTGAPAEGTVEYQWYPSVVTTAEVTDETPGRPTSLLGYETYATFDSATRTWSGLYDENAGNVMFLGFNATKGTDVTFAAKLAGGSGPLDDAVVYGTDMSFAMAQPIGTQGDMTFFKARAPTSKGCVLLFDLDGAQKGLIVVSNLVTTTQTIDYAHPIAGQTGAAYDFSDQSIDRGTFANVASFIDADGVTTNFTMASDIISFFVERDDDGNIIAFYDQPISSTDDLVDLFKSGGSGYLTKDFQLEATDALQQLWGAGKWPEGGLMVGLGSTTRLCLDGRVLDLNGMFIHNRGELIVSGGKKSGTHYFNVAEDMRWVLMNDTSAARSVKGGVIYNGIRALMSDDNPSAIFSVNAATTQVARVNFVGNGGVLCTGIHKSGIAGNEKFAKTLVDSCFFAGNTTGSVSTVFIQGGTNQVFRNSVITENLGLVCGGIGSELGDGLTLIDITITNNYALGERVFSDTPIGVGGAAFLFKYPVFGGKIVIKDNYSLVGGVTNAVNAAFINSVFGGQLIAVPELLPSFSDESEIHVLVANQLLGGPAVCPFILALSNETDYSSCFFPDDSVSIISYNAAKQVQLITEAVVHFDTHGGSSIADTNTLVGLKLVKPADPVRYGSAFAGWYADAECTQEWDFDNDVVPAADFTLHAGWLALRMVVYDAAGGAFEADGADVRVDFQPPANPKYDFPEDPVRTNYTFLGWYDGVASTANKLVNGDPVEPAVTNVFAKWQSNAVTPGSPSGAGGTTADGLAVTNYHPTVAIADGNVVIPDTVDNTPNGKAIIEIGRSAYTPAQYGKLAGATPITSVVLPTFVTQIKNYAFCQNSALTNVTFSPVYDYKTGEKTTLYIRDYAFANTAITNLVFPAGGTYKLGHNAFSHNPMLKDVWIYGQVTVESLNKSPFREIGEGLGEGQKVNFHISPSQALDKDFIYALTNGVNAAHVIADVDTRESGAVLGEVPVASSKVTFDDPIVVEFTLPADAPWQMVTTNNVYFLYAEEVADLTVGNGQKLKPYEMTPKGGNQYEAKFVKPAADSGFFRLFVGE